MSFGSVLKDLRRENNMSQAKLSKHIGFSQSVISDWENAISEPNIIALKEIADYFKVSTDYLLGRADDFGNLYDNNYLTTDQRLLLNVYNNCNDIGKGVILSYVKGVADAHKIKLQ